MNHSPSPYITAESVDEACELLEAYGQDAKVLAGGQSLSLLLRQDLLDPEVIVDVPNPS
jgi:CO/xanthine dehydrogenase FAD-binding subunit